MLGRKRLIEINDECPMTNDERMMKSKCPNQNKPADAVAHSGFVISDSLVIRISSFVISSVTCSRARNCRGGMGIERWLDLVYSPF